MWREGLSVQMCFVESWTPEEAIVTATQGRWRGQNPKVVAYRPNKMEQIAIDDGLEIEVAVQV
jgi:hypothetical protein